MSDMDEKRENDEVEGENGNRSKMRRLMDKEKSRDKGKHEGESTKSTDKGKLRRKGNIDRA